VFANRECLVSILQPTKVFKDVITALCIASSICFLPFLFAIYSAVLHPFPCFDPDLFYLSSLQKYILFTAGFLAAVAAQLYFCFHYGYNSADGDDSENTSNFSGLVAMCVFFAILFTECIIAVGFVFFYLSLSPYFPNRANCAIPTLLLVLFPH